MINQISSPLQVQAPLQNTQPQASAGKTGFGDMLKQAITDLNTSQVQSANMTQALAEGKNVELQDVMIAAEKASVTLMSAVEFRNKAVEAYQEIMRMQM